MDLNIIVGNSEHIDPDKVINEKLCRCKELGFLSIALAVIIDPPKEGQINVPKSPKLDNLVIPKGLQVYTRLTVKVSETIQIFKVNKSKERSNYDLLALEPQNVKMLQYLTSASTPFDILTFDLTDRLDYNLFRLSFNNLEKIGICIEINYGPAQLSSTLRRNTITNGQSLTERSSRNIILSSGIEDTFRLRGPKDAKYLGVIFLLSTSRSHDAVYKNGAKAIHHAKHRTNPASSAIELKVESNKD